MASAYADQRINTLIGALLSESPSRVSECFTTEGVREALITNFDYWAQARAKDTDDGRLPLWDLRMNDGDIENAAFIVWVWDEENVWLACGTGESYEVQHFCGQRAACECSGLFAAIRERFRMSADPLPIPRRDIERWINRTWTE